MLRCCNDLRQRCNRYIGTAMQISGSVVWMDLNKPLWNSKLPLLVLTRVVYHHYLATLCRTHLEEIVRNSLLSHSNLLWLCIQIHLTTFLGLRHSTTVNTDSLSTFEGTMEGTLHQLHAHWAVLCCTTYTTGQDIGSKMAALAKIHPSILHFWPLDLPKNVDRL